MKLHEVAPKSQTEKPNYKRVSKFIVRFTRQLTRRLTRRLTDASPPLGLKVSAAVTCKLIIATYHSRLAFRLIHKKTVNKQFRRQEMKGNCRHLLRLKRKDGSISGVISVKRLGLAFSRKSSKNRRRIVEESSKNRRRIVEKSLRNHCRLQSDAICSLEILSLTSKGRH